MGLAKGQGRVMEYLGGETLAQRLERGPLEPRVAMTYACQIASALAEAHRLGVLHGDLKPPNILLTAGDQSAGVGIAKLLNFGLATTHIPTVRVEDRAAVSTKSDDVTPSPLSRTRDYMAPEQQEGKEADARSDIFALGAVLYEMLTGRKASELRWTESTWSSWWISIENWAAPEELRYLIQRSIHPKPDNRFQSMDQLREELVSALASQTPTALRVQEYFASAPNPRQCWDGRPYRRNESVTDEHRQLAKAAKTHDWSNVIDLLAENPYLVNANLPDNQRGHAPLHVAARAGAPPEVIHRLVELGAWRGLRTPGGKRPMDIAERHGHKELVSLLGPPVVQRVERDALIDIERHFHALIYGRVADLVSKHGLRLPQLECLTEMAHPRVMFHVPGMYGGFDYQLRPPADNSATLYVRSWCRIVDGSLETHEVTTRGYELIA